MEDSVTVPALAGRVQVERIDWLLVPADLTYEASATADQALADVAEAKLYCSSEGGDQEAGVELLEVGETVSLCLCVEILPRPDSLRQADLDSLLAGPGAG